MVLLFADGSAGLLTGARRRADGRLPPRSRSAGRTASVAVDELRLSQFGRARRCCCARPAGIDGGRALQPALADRPGAAGKPFAARHRLASLTLSILTIFPPLLVMTMVNKVLQFHSVSTLVLMCVILLVVSPTKRCLVMPAG